MSNGLRNHGAPTGVIDPVAGPRKTRVIAYVSEIEAVALDRAAGLLRVSKSDFVRSAVVAAVSEYLKSRRSWAALDEPPKTLL